MHLRSQNWFAVGFEFIIVVVGIFVGLQADAWNENRKERIRERVAMEQILADFTVNAESIGRMVEFHVDKADELAFAMNTLIRGEIAPDEVLRFRNAFVSMFQLPPLGATMGGYDAMIGSGDLALIQSQTLKAKLVSLNANLDAEQSLLDYFRNNNVLDMQTVKDLVQVVPNEDRTDAVLQVDFDAAKDDFRILTIVSSQRRNHQLFGRVRRDLAAEFEETSTQIKQLLDE